MKDYVSYYTISFNHLEKQELLEILKDNPKWRLRIENGLPCLLTSSFESLGDGFQYCAVCNRQSSCSGVVRRYHWVCDQCKKSGKK